MPSLSRRTLLAGAAATGAVTYRPETPAAAQAGPPATVLAPTPATDGTTLTWLDGGAPAAGTTFGVPWPRGAVPPEQTFALTSADGTAVPLQTWATGFWPDGTLKWTAHATGPQVPASTGYHLTRGSAAAPAVVVTVTETRAGVTVDTGVIRAVLPRVGDVRVRHAVHGRRAGRSPG